MQELVEGAATADRIGAWLDFPEQFAEALKLQFVIALDEFQELGLLESQRKRFNPFTLSLARSLRSAGRPRLAPVGSAGQAVHPSRAVRESGLVTDGSRRKTVSLALDNSDRRRRWIHPDA